MAIIQLTDIHLDATYGGKFPTMVHLDKVIQDIRKRRSEHLRREDVIIITGDICDGDDRYYYEMVFDMLHRAFPETPVLVTPGNHDDREILDEIALRENDRSKRLGMEFEYHGRISRPGAYGVTLEHNHHKLLILDTGHSAKDDTCEFLDTQKEYLSGTKHEYLVFSHMPVIPVPHRFMQQDGFCMKQGESSSRIADLAKAIFCGHYHFANTLKAVDYALNGRRSRVDQYVCPAIQCQLDPYSPECSPSGVFPGYQVIHCPITGEAPRVETRLLY